MSSTKMTADSSKKNIVEIYTDWANHYLEKTKVCNNKKDCQPLHLAVIHDLLCFVVMAL